MNRRRHVQSRTRLFTGIVLVLWGWTALGFYPGTSMAAGSRIGVIDTRRILNQSQTVQQTRAVFFKEVAEQKKVLRAKQEQIRTMALRLERRSAQLSGEALKEIRANHARQIKAFERDAADIDEELKQRERALTNEFKRKIREIVRTILQERHYAAVFERNTAIAVDETIDITAEVIRRYDAAGQRGEP